MDIQELVNKAQELMKEGKFDMAVFAYGDAMFRLYKEANKYAGAQEGSIVYIDGLEDRTSKFYQESQQYLRRDNRAAIIHNGMAVISAESGDYDTAKGLFEAAIGFTPDGTHYPDPIIGLESINKERTEKVLGTI